MNNTFTLIVDENHTFAKQIGEFFAHLGAEIIFTDGTPLDIRLKYTIFKPLTAIIYDHKGDLELFKCLKAQGIEPDFCLICKANPQIYAEFRQVKCFYSENLDEMRDCVRLKIINKLDCGEMLQKELNDYTSELINNAMSELGFSPKYSGTNYIKTILRLVCLGKISPTAPVTKEIYPAAAKIYKMQQIAIERSVRYAIEMAWLHTSNESKVYYFGNYILNGERPPTNREFVRAIADKLICKVEEKCIELKKDLVRNM